LLLLFISCWIYYSFYHQDGVEFHSYGEYRQSSQPPITEDDGILAHRKFKSISKGKNSQGVKVVVDRYTAGVKENSLNQILKSSQDDNDEQDLSIWPSKLSKSDEKLSIYKQDSHDDHSSTDYSSNSLSEDSHSGAQSTSHNADAGQTFNSIAPENDATKQQTTDPGFSEGMTDNLTADNAESLREEIAESVSFEEDLHHQEPESEQDQETANSNLASASSMNSIQNPRLRRINGQA
jgi:hypothetical protein